MYLSNHTSLLKFYFLFLSTMSICLVLIMMQMTETCRNKSPSIPKLDRMCTCNSMSRTTEPINAKNWEIKWPNIVDKNLKDCIRNNTNLQGRLNIKPSVTAEDVRNVKAISNLKYGGIYRPTDCKSNESMAVIIPYRDRSEHLETLVNHLHSILQRQNLNYGIYVVEMALPAQFNRGLLANAGYLTAKSIGKYSCYIIHDVDLVPINDMNLYKCGKGPRHLLTNSTKFPLGIPYNSYVGGVLALSDKQYTQINGFSNLYFGWGGEDDDMFRRIQSSHLTLERPHLSVGLFVALEHKGDLSNPPNPHRITLLHQATNRKHTDGLNTIKYQRKALEFRNLYTWILISCVESEVLDSFPELHAESKLLMKNGGKGPKTNMKIIPGNKARHKYRYKHQYKRRNKQTLE